jgi:hypothetical protein
MAGLILASPAIRSCFVDTLSGFKAPSCFSETTLFTTVLRFPRSGPLPAAFPDVSSVGSGEAPGKGWPPPAAQTGRAVFPHPAFTMTASVAQQEKAQD